MKKRRAHQPNFILPVIMALLIFVTFFIFKSSNFNEVNFLLRNKQIPDVVELPKDVKESIKNLKPQKSFSVPILLYHYVEYVKDEGDTIRKSLNITPDTFDAEIKTLKDAGYEFITIRDLADALDDKITFAPKSVILTFDDGYRDFYTDVFPILKKYNVKAVAFVVPNFLGSPNNLDTWMLSEIAKSGLVEIGAHTMNHSYLTGLPLEGVKYEVMESKKYLEDRLGIKVSSFAYPYGAFDNTTIDVVKKAGFRAAVTTIPGTFTLDVNRFFLYRIRPGGRIGTALLDLLEQPNLAKLEGVSQKD